MGKRSAWWTAAALLTAAGLAYLSYGMRAPEAVRKLSGLRMALALYTLGGKPPPPDFGDVIRSGKLEAAPVLKLRWHLRSGTVANAPSRAIRDTGGWVYVNAPGDPDFGQVFIDCSHRDAKGRFWSEF